MKKNKGNLIVSFIMVVALSITVFAFLSYIGIRLRESGIRVSEIESFYVADAGVNKAIWYLGTPTGSGGKGFSWRVSSSYEAFGWGGFLLTVRDYAANEVQIISTGEVGGIMKTVSQVVGVGGLPEAFDYAIYCNSGADYSGAVNVQGDVYMNGNTKFGADCSFTGGYVYHPAGTSLTGDGSWTDGGAMNPAPGFPVFDSSYYDNLITAAKSVPVGSQTYSGTTLNLNGSTIYVNGDVKISGNTTINGPGAIVATGKIDQSGNTYSSSSPMFISGHALSVSGNTYTSGATYYSATEIDVSGDTRVDVGSVLSKGKVKLTGNLNLSGIIFADTGATVVLGNPVIRGALVASKIDKFSGNANVVFDESKFPSNMPTGFTASTLTVKKGSWKGN